MGYIHYRPTNLPNCFISFVLCLTFCSLLFAACSTIVYAAPPFWTQERRISLGSALSDEVDSCSRGDEIYAVWSDNRTGNREIFFIFSPNAGQSWSDEERLTDTPSESIQPAIASDRKSLHIVWREKTEDSSEIYYKRWDGKAWSDALLLSGGYKNSQRPDIASTTIFPGFYIYVVWDSDEEGRTTAYLTRSADAGQSFSKPQPIATGNWSTREPAICGGARDAYLAWVDNREGDWNIYFKRWGEVQAGADIKLSGMPDCHAPAICGAEPGVYAAWQCVEKGKVYADIYFSFSTNQGMTWAGAKNLTQALGSPLTRGSETAAPRDGKAESVFPKITISDKMTYVFWQDGRNGEWQIFFSMLDTGYSTLDTEYSMLALTNFDKPNILLDAVSTPGQIHAFWTRSESNTQANIMYMRRDTVAPKPPGTPLHFDLSASPGYDDDNQITFLWDAPSGARIDGGAREVGKEKLKYNVYSRVDNGNFILSGSTEKTSYNVSGERGKTYQVYIEAVDEVGNASIPSGISARIECDPDAPEVTIHSPHSDSTIRGDIPIIVSVRDVNLLEYIVEYGITAAPSIWWRLADTFQKEADRERIMTWVTSGLDGIYSLRIAARDKAGNESRALAIVNIDSRPPMAVSPGEVTQLTEPDTGWTYGMPAWSPRGDKIAYNSDEGGSEDIWVMSWDGSNCMRLTRSVSVEHNPAWSPSGDMIAFQSFTEDSLWDIWVMKADGRDAKRIVAGKSSDENPVWSPDGTAIAYDSDRDQALEKLEQRVLGTSVPRGDSEIFVVTNVQNVLKGAEPQFFQLTYNDWEDRHPTWSPDGSKIIFQSSRRGNWDLFEIGIDGKNSNIILATAADEIEPAWSPDRKRVLFSTNESGDHYEINAVNWPETPAYAGAGQVRLSPKGEDARHASWSPTMDSIVYEHEGSLYSVALEYPVGNLEAIISWPRGGEVLKGEVDVEGIACGEIFQSYRLEYSYLGSSSGSIFSNPQPIGGEATSPVLETGFLGRWHTTGLEGEYLLRLTVTGADGSSAEDSVRVLIANQVPFILLDEPQNGLITDNSIITVSGRTGQRVVLSLNNTVIYTNPDGSFSRKIQLTEGSNSITVKAAGPAGQSQGYTVERTVFLDTKPPGIIVESPKDFQMIRVPYVEVKGHVDEEAEISILSTRVWPDKNGNFQREVLCSEGANLISVVASDKLGHYSSVMRRVIFQRDTEVVLDTSAPAIADVFPDNRAVVTSRDLQISATFIDDIGLDPTSIAFSFDGKEMAVEAYELDIEMPGEAEDFPRDMYPVVHFKYRPVPPVAQGNHSLKIGIKDTSGNAEESSYNFSVDTIPSTVLVSAHLKDTNQIRVTAVANKPLAKISRSNIYNASEGELLSGYSLSSFIQKEGYYEAYLDISPSQRSFIIDFSGKTYLGDEVIAYGYMAWDAVRYGERMYLGVEGRPQFLSEPMNRAMSDLVLTLRSQDGLNNGDLDTEILALQQYDAEYRRLKPSGLVYVLSASKEIRNGELQGVLSLPADDDDIQQRLVMFRWDEDQKQWQPLDRIGLSAGAKSTLESQVDSTGIYTLFADTEPPAIKSVYPKDMGEADRFFVEASILDRGSGISQINLMIDGKPVNYEYEPIRGRLVYYPSNLEWGLHNMEITAMDRAGNIANISTSFATRAAFQFILVHAYPNPAYSNVSIEFRLTRSADVTLRIYTIAGELIYSYEKKNVAEGKFIWRRENSSGNKVASGVYIYSVEASLYENRVRKKGAISVIY